VPTDGGLYRSEFEARNVLPPSLLGRASCKRATSTNSSLARPPMGAANPPARDAMMMNYKVIFVSDGTATHTDEGHNATLGKMVTRFADVMNTGEVLACLSSAVSRTAE
jgi:hypothetical protein